MRIKHLHHCPLLLKDMDDFPCRAFPCIVNIRFIGHSQYPHSCIIQTYSYFVELLFKEIDGVEWHPFVNLPCENEELVHESVLLGLRNQVVGINGNAMPADASAWVVGQEAEGLCRCPFDDFCDVYACLVEAPR